MKSRTNVMPLSKVGTALLIVLFCLLPVASFRATAEYMVYPNRLSVFVEQGARNPFYLAFPVLVALPTGLSIASLSRYRFLQQVLVRDEKGNLISLVLWRVAISTFALVSICLAIGVLNALNMPVKIESQQFGSGLVESTSSTFSELVDLHPYLYYIWMILFTALHGVSYALIGACCVLWVRNRFLALCMPWIGFFAFSYGLAVLGLESFSPLTVSPYNLKQLPAWNPLVALVVLISLALVSCSVTVRKYRSLPGFQ